MIKKFITITKPGIIFGNLISVAGGFFLAAKGTFDWVTLVGTLVGVSLVVACGCVLNNCIDRDIDKKMERTRTRVLAQGEMPLGLALIYAQWLGIVGLTTLYLTSNLLAVGVAFGGLVIYVGFYSLLFKRNSVHGTLIGSFSGAAPPLAGYVAVTNQLDLGAGILFLIFSLWQMPHSYAIAIFRLKDYSAASIKVLPVAKGILVAKHHIVAYIVLFVMASLALTLTGYTGYFYLAAAMVLGGYWLCLAVRGYKAQDDVSWARKVFGFSILTVTLLSLMMSIDATVAV
ncbi:heme o synthase [Gallaecimonas kandeliae]|uniref:heme o synthase n=1 Tax=Gallaecimonas kandeliae TaxID=3029055 RepID=UPI002648DAE3|nr:heme o synthase [Gallaecimonas kandeliae]WKE63911.1 heme o synthase [Gallaecimonas kandeliae]